ncbi:MAG TPA: hypothetical protein GXX54_01655 [Clostridiales bacterium]|nr:hypothetical protein [Clostridiales bacterium]
MKKYLVYFLILVITLLIPFAGETFSASADNLSANDFPAGFYEGSNWKTLTSDIGTDAVSLADGSVRFVNTNKSYKTGPFKNSRVSFMLKAGGDWSMRIRASESSNNGEYYVLGVGWGELNLQKSESNGKWLAKFPKNTGYEANKWCRFDIEFIDETDKTTIRIYINGNKVNLLPGDEWPNVTVSNGDFIDTKPIQKGDYWLVKVWGISNTLQLKSVANKDKSDSLVKKVACVGDSITAGAGASDYWTTNYPSQLQKLLGKGYNVMNFGNSGKTLIKTFDDPYWNTEEFKASKSFNPDIVVIMLGTNDSKTHQWKSSSKSQFISHLTELVKTYKSLPSSPKVIIATSPAAFSTTYNISNDNITKDIVPAQKQVAQEQGCTVVDINALTQNKKSMFSDGIHPNDSGYSLIASSIKDAILSGKSVTATTIKSTTKKAATSAQTTQAESTVTESPESTDYPVTDNETEQNVTDEADKDAGTDSDGGGSVVKIVIIVMVIVILAAGGICTYFFVIKKKTAN